MVRNFSIILLISFGCFGQTAFNGMYPSALKHWPHVSDATPTLSTTARIGFCGYWTSYGQGNKSIRKVRFATEWVDVGSGSGVTISLQDPDTSTTYPMRPDNTEDQAVTMTGLNNGDHRPFLTSSDLSADRSMQEGDAICAVVRWDDSGRQGSDYVQFRTARNLFNPGGGNSSIVGYTSAWGELDGTFVPAVEFVNSDGTISGLIGAPGAFSLSGLTYNSASSPNKYGVRFTPSIGFTSVSLYILGNLTKDYSVVLCDQSGTPLKTVSVAGYGGYAYGVSGYHAVPFGYSFSANTEYNLEVVPGSDNVTLLSTRFVSSSSLRTVGALGLSLISRTGTGSYSVDGTQYIPIQFEISSVSAGSSPTSTQTPIQ